MTALMEAPVRERAVTTLARPATRHRPVVVTPGYRVADRVVADMLLPELTAEEERLAHRAMVEGLTVGEEARLEVVTAEIDRRWATAPLIAHGPA